MKNGKILVEVENEEDLNQLEIELEAAINHTTHLTGDVNIIDTEVIDDE